MTDFLEQMAAASAAAGGAAGKKKRTPVYELSEHTSLNKFVTTLSNLLEDRKDIDEEIASCKNEISDFAVQRRNSFSKRDGQYYTTVKLRSTQRTLSITIAAKYSKIPLSARDKIIDVLDGNGFEGGAEAAFEERFSKKSSISIASQSLQDPDNKALLDKLLLEYPRLRSMLDVTAHYVPKESWVKTFMFSEQEQDIIDELEEQELMVPHSPTYKVSS